METDKKPPALKFAVRFLNFLRGMETGLGYSAGKRDAGLPKLP